MSQSVTISQLTREYIGMRVRFQNDTPMLLSDYHRTASDHTVLVLDGRLVWCGDTDVIKIHDKDQKDEWQPTRWRRLISKRDGSIWMETSDEEECREELKKRKGLRFQRLFEKVESEWRDI